MLYFLLGGSNMRKTLSMLLAFLFAISSFTVTQAGTSMAEAEKKTLVYAKRIIPQLLVFQGVLSEENFAAHFVVYKADDGKEYPAYCINPDKVGADETGYEVDIDQTITNPKVWGAITNGYPYKTPQELGVNSDDEAYYATKIAVWTIVHDNYNDLSDWTANGANNEQVLTAMKAIRAAGDATTSIPQGGSPVTITPTNAVTAKVGEFLVAEFTIASTNEVEYEVDFATTPPPGTKITDMSGQEKTKFNTSEKFKIMIPVTNTDRGGNFNLSITTPTKGNTILWGKSHASVQDYALSGATLGSGTIQATVAYSEEVGEPDPDPVQGQLLIQKFEKGTIKGLPGAIFRVTDATGGIVGDYITDGNGQVTVILETTGAYYVDEIVPPVGYQLDEDNHKDIVVTDIEEAVLSFANRPCATLDIMKVDADSNAKLAGAIIRVSLDGGSQSIDVETDASGLAHLDNLKDGTYTVTEIVAPDGYLLDSTPHSIKLEGGKVAAITLKNRTKPGLIIKKYDEDSGLPLKGAEFSVKKKDGSIVYEGITDLSGIIRLTDLEPDWYTVTEIAAPSGYLIATTSKDVKLEPNKTAEIKFDNRLRPSLQIMKFDSQTNKPLAGAKFKVQKTEGGTVSEYVTDATGTIIIHDLEEAIYLVEEFEAPDGYLLETQHKDIQLEWGKTKSLIFTNKAKPSLEILKIDEDSNLPLAGAKFKVTRTEGNTTSEYVTDATGRILITGLKDEIYSVEEIVAPSGYILEPQHKDIELEWGVTKKLVFTNKAKPSLEILKIDEDTSKPLAGAKFKVTKTEDNTTSEYVTDATGKIVISGLDGEIYSIEEIVAPSGYLLEPQHKDIELEWGKKKSVVFTNKLKPSLQIIKVDSQTNKPLAGAKFKVTKTDDNTVSEYITDNTGTITIHDLEDTTYSVEELKAPDGYLLENQHKDIKLEWGKMKTLVFENKARPALEIRKIDENTKLPLAGAKFRVTRTEGNTTSDYVTDATGRIVITGLEAEIYSIEEIVAPFGYILEPQHRDIELEWGKTKTVVFTNKARPALEIKKIDAITKLPLVGAKFKVTKTEDMTVSEYVTDATGIVLIKNLDESIYTVDEVVAPEGYILETQHKEIQLECGKTKTLVYEDTRKPTLIITKTNALTYKPIPNTTYKVEYEAQNGGVVSLGTFRTDIKGQIILPKVATGWYIITETLPAPGYSSPSNPVVRKFLAAGENAYSETTPTTPTGGGQPVAAPVVTTGKDYDLGQEIINYPLNSIVIKKADANNGELLAGAAFEVRQVSEDVSGNSGTVIGRYTTDNSGIIVLTGLNSGAYIVEEVQAPTNYMLSENSQQQAWLKPDGTSIVEVTFANYPYGSILVTKIDAKTGSPLANARFKVTDGNNAVVGNTNGEYITNQNGEFLVSKVKPDSYVVTEIEAPEGYSIDTTPQTVTVGTDGKTYKVSFKNQPFSTLVLLKLDSATNIPLANAEFKVTTSKGNVVGTGNGIFRTNATGTITIPNLPKDSYIVQEMKAPDGYILENQSKTIDIDYGKSYTLEFYNKPMSSVIINKIDSNTKQPLSNARFTVNKKNGDVIGQYTTNGTGIIQIDDLEPGWYNAIEVKAPTGYLLDQTPQEFEIKHTKTVTLTFENNPMSNVLIKKFDQETKAPLIGAKFKITKKSGDIIGEYSTDSNGIIQLDNLDTGWYTAVEVKAPIGYKLVDTARDFEIKHTKTVTLEFPNEKLTSLAIKKIDDKTGEPLGGAKFAVEKQNGQHVGEYTTDNSGFINLPTLTPDWYTIREIKAPDGYKLDETPKIVEVKTVVPTVITFTNKKLTALEIKKIDEVSGEPLGGAKFAVEKQNGERVGEYTTDNTGFISIPTLAPDWYVVREIKAPTGYLLDETPKTVEVKTVAPTVVTFTNKKLTALQIKKIDDKSGEPLGGAKFIIEKQDGKLIGEYTTDNTGYINIPTLDPDWYVVHESKAPTGYLLDETPKNIQVKTDTPTVTTFTNKKLTALQIIKIDEESGEPLGGAKFAVEKQNGERVGEYTTDNAGFINIPTLAPDWYAVREIKSPTGYLLDEKPKLVEVKTNVPTVVTFTNKKLTALQIKKVDVKSGEPLGGATFIIEKQTGELVGEYTTNNTGYINIPTLDPDWYVVHESKAPEGYLLDETPKNVEVKTDKPTVITFTNKKLTALQIKKVDEQSGEPLSGAKFTIEKQNGEKIGEYTSDIAGLISIPTLLPDWYVVREIKAPIGYFLDETPKTVQVKTDVPTIVSFTNKKLTALQIKKVDEQSGEPLSGAKFTIEKQNGEKVGEYTSDIAGLINIPTLLPDWYVVRETKAPIGYFLDETPKTVQVKTDVPTIVSFTNKKLTAIQIKKIDEISGKPLVGAKFAVEKQNGERVGEYSTDETGFINIPTLAPGYYVVRETKAPIGYILDETPKTIEVKTVVPTILTFTNKPLSALQIKKINSVTREPIAGVEFSISKMSGEKITTIKTGKDGLAYVSELSPGWYSLYELSTAEGYILDKEPHNFEVTFGKPVTLEIENTPISSLLIYKTDANTRKPLEGVRFDVTKANGEMVGTYTTDKNGRILVNDIQAGKYLITEKEALKGYELDTKVYEAVVNAGKQTVVEVQNKAMSGLRILKVDSITKKPIFNVEFMIFDESNKVVGTYYTDNNGIIDFAGILTAGKYTIRETRAAEGYYLDEIPKTINFESGKYTEITWQNVPKMGQIQITKKSANDNEINGLPAGTPLEGAIFEVYAIKSGNLLDRIVSGKDGKAVTQPLPTGRYLVKEVQAPQYYKLNPKELDIEIEFATQIVKLEFTNESANTGVLIKKVGNYEAMPGDTIKYDIKTVQNTSTVPLTNFFWRDVVPVDATRLNKIITGTYNQSVKFKVTGTTNKGNTIIIADNLSTTQNNAIDCSSASLGLKSDEFVTTFTLYFGNVKAGFASVEAPQIYVNVLKNLPNGYQFANKCDVGGKSGTEWVVGNSTWKTTIYRGTSDKLPKTGY